MAKANLYGQMVFNMKDNLQIIESQARVYINGQMEAYMKVKSKMDSGMEQESISLIKPLMKDNGLKEKNKVKAK